MVYIFKLKGQLDFGLTVLLKYGESPALNIKQGGDTVKELLLQTYTIALPTILGYIVWLLKRQKKDRDANSKGTMLLLRVQLIEYHDKYIALGEIPSYAYENFCEMYEAYHALRGNGMITKMYDEIQELHLRKGEVRNERH